MGEDNCETNSGHVLNNGVVPHQLTLEDRRRGGSVSKFNNVKHGRFAEKLSEKYTCPSCHIPIEAGHILEQRARLLQLTKGEDLLVEIQTTMSQMREVLENEPDARAQFTMCEKYTSQLLKLLERVDVKVKKTVEPKSINFEDLFGPRDKNAPTRMVKSLD